MKRQNTLAWLKNELRIFSEAWNIINSAKTFNNLWEDKFTNFLRKHWIICGEDGVCGHKSNKYIKRRPA